ncbi:MAG: hypothetical protein PUB22_07025 [Clostridiales bacterium]|nr:hypothetical protein [Clostridiales bacterium]
MSKNRKNYWYYILGLITMASLVLGMSGCSRKPTAASVMIKALKASADITMVSMDWTMDMGMSMSIDVMEESMNMDMDIEAKGNTLCDSSSGKTHSTVDMAFQVMGMDMNQQMEMYTAVEDETLTVYMMMEDQWVKQSEEMEDPSAANVIVEIKNLLAFTDSFVLLEDMAEKNGHTCYELKSTMDPEDTEDLMNSFMDMDEFLDSEQGMDLDSMNDKVMEVTLYIDEESSLIQAMSLKLMTDTQAADTESDKAEEKDSGLSGFSMEIAMEYPEPSEIVIPPEALAAEEQESMDPLLETDTDDEFYGQGSMFHELEHPAVIVEFGDTEKLLYEKDGIKVYLVRVYTDDEDNGFIDLNLENHSDTSLDVYSLGFSLNNTMLNDYGFYETLPAGESVISCIYVTGLSQYGISEIGSLSMGVVAAPTNDFTDEIMADRVEYVIDENKSDYNVVSSEGKRTVYEDEYIRVTAYAETADDYIYQIPLCIENKTDTDFFVMSDSAISRGITVNAALYGDLFAGTCIYTCLEFDPSEWKEANLPIPGTVQFGVGGYDIENMSGLFYAEITIPSSL